MESTTTGNLGNFAKDAADKASDKAAPLLREATDRAKSTARQSMDAINDFAGQARDFAGQARDAASSATDSVVGYTKANPLKSLAIAAASGALIYAAIKSLRSLRD